MKPSSLKSKNEPKKNIKTKLVIKDDIYTKLQNEVFPKPYERNNTSNERFNTIDKVPSKRNIHNSRSNSNFRENRERNKSKNAERKNYPDANGSSGAKSMKVYRVPYNERKYRVFPNLIGGVLNQVNYNNTNNNNNYNENTRYKPLDTFFTEHSFLSNKKDKENNNNSGNISFNSDNQNGKNDKNITNIKKVKIDEEENNDNNFNNENNDNTNDNIYNSYNVENEIKLVNPDNMKNRKSDVIENGKTISPIISSQGTDENRIKKEKNDIIGQYVNNNPEKNDNSNDSNANKPISEEIIDDSHPDKRNFAVQNVKEFVINKNDNLELTPEKKFSIYHGKERNSSDTKDDYKKQQNREGKLIFNNDDEVVDYIKKRLKDDIDEEYNSGIKYNFFNLQKKFRGRILYEIGLENDIKKINAILEKQNVQVEKENVVFIKKKDLDKLKKGIYVDTDSKEEIERLNKENAELKEKIDSMNKNLRKKNSDSEKDFQKLKEEIDRLNNTNKELEKQLKNKDNSLNQNKDIDKIMEDYNRLQAEREKFIKYINELQEYDEKVILEYQKVKQQLEDERKKNNMLNNGLNSKQYFNNDELEEIPKDFFTISSRKKKKNIRNYAIDYPFEISIVYDRPKKKKHYDNVIEEYNDYIKSATKPVNEEEFGGQNYGKNDEDYNDNDEQNYGKKNKVSFAEAENIDPEELQKRREEKLRRAFKRLNHKRDEDKENEKKNAFRKSEKIKDMAGELENTLNENEKDDKFYVDLEYEKNKAEEEENNN